MSPRRFVACAAPFAFALMALIAAAPLAQARSLALVIGNDAYANVTALKTATGDARATGDQLEKMGSRVSNAVGHCSAWSRRRSFAQAGDDRRHRQSENDSQLRPHEYQDGPAK